MAEITDAEFWDRLRRQFLAIASLIEKRYLDKEVKDAEMVPPPGRYKGQGTPMKSQGAAKMSPVALNSPYAWIYHCNRCGHEVWFRQFGDLPESPKHDCSDMPRSEEPRTTVTSHRR